MRGYPHKMWKEEFSEAGTLYLPNNTHDTLIFVVVVVVIFLKSHRCDVLQGNDVMTIVSVSSSLKFWTPSYETKL